MTLALMIMLLTYFAVLAVSTLILAKAFHKELKAIVDRGRIRVFSRFSRFIVILKIIKITLIKPAIVVAILSLLLFTLISAQAVSTKFEEVKVCKCNSNVQAVFIELNNEINNKELSDYIKSVISYMKRNNLQLNCLRYYPILRKIFDEPIKVDDLGEYYVMIVITKELLSELMRSEVNCNILMSCEKLKEIQESIGSNAVQRNVCCIPNKEMLHMKLPTGNPLLPVQSYLGTKPILPPPYATIILTREVDLAVLSNVTRNLITDILILNKCLGKEQQFIDVIIKATLNSRFSRYVKSIWYCINGEVYVMSNVTVPTLRSVITALIAAITSSILTAISLTSVLPYLKKVYSRLSLVGLPTWTIPIISFSITTIMVSVVSIPTLFYVLNEYGGTATLNALITICITWISSTIFLIKKLEFKELRTDVYTPVTKRYSMIMRLPKVDGVIMRLKEAIRRSILTNEFFEVEEMEDKVFNNELVMHARIRYVECWGSGLDLNIISHIEKDEVKLHITSYVWSIEEISESILNTMLSLAISRIVGGVKAWV